MKTDEFKKIITFAISNEIEAYDFYKGVADKTKDAGLKKIFAELAEEEAKHRKFLEASWLYSRKGQEHPDPARDQLPSCLLLLRISLFEWFAW